MYERVFKCLIKQKTSKFKFIGKMVFNMFFFLSIKMVFNMLLKTKISNLNPHLCWSI